MIKEISVTLKIKNYLKCYNYLKFNRIATICLIFNL